jgi:hypothetical protein
VGDCFLLTSLSALLTAEPDGFSLYAMMRDLGTGWVLVRFFKDVGPETNIVLAPYCVKIQKTVPKFVGFGQLYARGPLWVAMLEKAYAAAHYKGSYEASLRGGKPRDALMHLTGLVPEAGDDRFAYADAKGMKTLQDLFELGQGVSYMVHYADKKPKVVEEVDRTRRTVLGNSQVLFNQWLAFNKGGHMKTSFDKLYAAQGDKVRKEIRVTGGADYIELRRQVLRREQFAKWFDQETKGKLPLPVAQAVMAFVTTENVFPGKRGTGIYTAENLETWTSIDTALMLHQPVTAGTFKEAGTTQSAIKGTVGESISKGLVGSHMYAVLGTAADEREPGLHWVKLRNPWGHMVRAYVREGDGPGKLKAVELNPGPTGSAPTRDFVKPESETQSVVALARQGLFWMELSDFVKRFSNIQTGAALMRQRR